MPLALTWHRILALRRADAHLGRQPTTRCRLLRWLDSLVCVMFTIFFAGAAGLVTFVPASALADLLLVLFGLERPPGMRDASLAEQSVRIGCVLLAPLAVLWLMMWGLWPRRDGHIRWRSRHNAVLWIDGEPFL